MSEIFKRKRKAVIGGVASVVVAARWTIRYRDHLGVRRLKAGFVDRKATEQLAARLERDAERVRSGVLTVPEMDGQRRTLLELVAEFRDEMLTKSVSPKHVELYRYRIAATFAAVKATLPSQLDGRKVGRWLAGERARKDAPMSFQTSNHYRRALSTFGGWMVKREYLARNPLADLPSVDVESHLVHVRRSISVEDFKKLISTTAAEVKRAPWGFTGERRSWLYITAAYTGFRARTLAALTPSSYDLVSVPPTVSAPASTVKNGRSISVPLPPWLSTRLAAYFIGKPPRDPLFGGMWAEHCGGGQMLSRDMKDAGIAKRDGTGRVFDFHALRDLYATWLVLSGASLSEVQKLLGHSSPSVTARHYIRLGVADLAKAVNRLPEL